MGRSDAINMSKLQHYGIAWTWIDVLEAEKEIVNVL